MKSKIVKALPFLLIIFVSLGLFYWYEWRPSEVKKTCNLEALKSADEAPSEKKQIYEFAFDICLKRNGI